MNIKFGPYFVSGIDTDCGKTYVTARMASYLRHRGITVITQKPVQTGCDMVSDDLVEHRKVMGCKMLPEDYERRTCSYLFKLPASPKLAAAQEGQTIDIEKIHADTLYLASRYNVVLVEGAGGLMVPLNDDYLTIDYVVAKRLPLILVASSRLGGINHALLSIEACHHRGVDLACVVFNRLPTDTQVMADDALAEITKYTEKLYPNTRIIDFRSSDSFWDKDF